jgi:Elongation factor Tu domain 2
MATGKKTKGKSKARRKKTRITKAATRRKTTTVRKTKTIRKKSTKKAPVRRASSKKARPTAKKARPTATAAIKPPARPPAKPVKAAPTPSLPAESAPPGERIGVVTHYYSHLSVATLRLQSGTLRVGDVIHIRGHTTDFSQRVESLEVNHAPATEVGPNDDFGLKVVQHAREHDVVYKVRP